jgi:trehalose 2-sulfotransferase
VSQLGQSVLSRPEPWPVTAYLLCGTPRTGSTLLCGLLQSTNVAGRPESYFRVLDEQTWANRWRLLRRPDGTFNHHDYVRAAIATGTTPNGVFGARVMWGTLDEIVIKLSSVYPELAGADLQLLMRAFGRTRFVYLWRTDVLAQAVSWARAEQTQFWQDGDERFQAHQPQFDFEQIRTLVQTIAEHNTAWRNWFARFRVQPHVVQYEELIADPAGVTRRILNFLGLTMPPNLVITPGTRRQADDLNADWIARYRALTNTSPWAELE